MNQPQPKTELSTQHRLAKTAAWLFLGVWILLPLCTVATYTWFAISRTPKVSDMEMTINSSTGLEIAWAADAAEEEWGLHLKFTDAVPGETLLTPVTWSQERGAFYTVSYGKDGRIEDAGYRLSDEKDTNSSDGHYVKFTFYGRTDEHVDVSLAPAQEAEEGTACTGTYLFGPPEWDAEEIMHKDGSDGAQYAMRVGLRITKLVGDTESEADFIIYEPNCDRHVDGTTGYTPTPSIDGADSLVPEDRLLRQTTSTFTECDPVWSEAVQYSLGDFEGETSLFELTPDEMVRIEVYIWLEGMDVDCVNAIGRGSLIFSNLQLVAEPHHNSGMVPIE